MLASAAPPAASDTTSVSRRAKAKPKGVALPDGVETGAPSRPCGPTGKLVSRLVLRSVTTSTSPSRLKPTWAGAVPPAADSGRTPSSSGSSVPWRLRKPATLPLPPAFST